MELMPGAGRRERGAGNTGAACSRLPAPGSVPMALAVAAGLALGCTTEPNTEILPASVMWMEWPVEVLAAEPFTVRLVGFGAECREVLRFETEPTVDQSAVTFEPYFVVGTQPQPCPLRELDPPPGTIIPYPSYFDTRAPVPPLTPTVPRSYEMRAATQQFSGGSEPAVRSFGDIVVRSDVADRSRTAVGGHGYAYRDSLDCLRITPLGIAPGYVVENPPDTASYWAAFVRGHLHPVPVPVCGERRVLRLEWVQNRQP